MQSRVFCFIAIAVLAIFSVRARAAGDGVEAADVRPLWKVAVITDTQTSQRQWTTALLGRLKEEKPDMVIHTGDTDFTWGDGFTLKAVADLVRTPGGGIEFHLAPGNHDLSSGVLRAHLRRASTQGTFRLETNATFKGGDYLRSRMPEYMFGPLWPVWNSEIINHLGWRSDSDIKLFNLGRPVKAMRYVFKRGGIRFIVCDWAYSKEQAQWLRNIITQPDDNSATIVLHHAYQIDKLSRYFKGLEGRHNVKLVLSGHDHHYHNEKRGRITYITGAGIARAERYECDAMILNVYRDSLRLDRYIIRKGARQATVLGPEPIWMAKGRFSEYVRPELPRRVPSVFVDSQEPGTDGINLTKKGYMWDGIFYERAK